jgi:hypothetical protein
MKFISWINIKMGKMDAWDMALVKWSCVLFGVLLVILIPSLGKINFWWLVLVIIIMVARPFYRILLKK